MSAFIQLRIRCDQKVFDDGPPCCVAQIDIEAPVESLILTTGVTEVKGAKMRHGTNRMTLSNSRIQEALERNGWHFDQDTCEALCPDHVGSK